MSLPLIGITTGYEDDRIHVHAAYVRAVETAGGLPVILPPVAAAATAKALVERLGALIVIGGPAVTEGMVGQVPADLEPTHPVRAASDHRFLDAADQSELPMLGICYGMQLVNARAGGQIYGDVQAQRPGTINHSERRGGTPHPISITAGTLLGDILGVNEAVVNTRHVQAIASPGAGMIVSALAPDGVIEALESSDGRFIGVQFHPETLSDDMLPLFRHLVIKAQERVR